MKQLIYCFFIATTISVFFIGCNKKDVLPTPHLEGYWSGTYSSISAPVFTSNGSPYTVTTTNNGSLSIQADNTSTIQFSTDPITYTGSIVINDRMLTGMYHGATNTNVISLTNVVINSANNLLSGSWKNNQTNISGKFSFKKGNENEVSTF